MLQQIQWMSAVQTNGSVTARNSHSSTDPSGAGFLFASQKWKWQPPLVCKKTPPGCSHATWIINTRGVLCVLLGSLSGRTQPPDWGGHRSVLGPPLTPSSPPSYLRILHASVAPSLTSESLLWCNRLWFTWLKVFSNRSFSAARRLLEASGGHWEHMAEGGERTREGVGEVVEISFFKKQKKGKKERKEKKNFLFIQTSCPVLCSKTGYANPSIRDNTLVHK